MDKLPDYVQDLAAPDAIEFAIVLKYVTQASSMLDIPTTFENFLGILSLLKDEETGYFCYQDELEELRCSGVDTGLESNNKFPRYFESKAVAKEVLPGVWVGWDYYYGGGKHSDPGGIEWVSDSYFVDVKTETRLVQIFTKVEGS